MVTDCRTEQSFFGREKRGEWEWGGGIKAEPCEKTQLRCWRDVFHTLGSDPAIMLLSRVSSRAEYGILQRHLPLKHAADEESEMRE